MIVGNGFIGKFIKEFNNDEVLERVELSRYTKGQTYKNTNKNKVYIFTSGISNINACSESKNKTEYTNQGTIDMILDIAKDNKVIFLSSDVVLGSQNCYSESKQTVEKAIKGNSNVRIVRLSYVFSDIQGYEDSFTKYALTAENVEIYEEYKRNIIHITDVLDGINYVVENFDKAPNIVNLVGENSISKTVLMKIINKPFSIITNEDSIKEFFKSRDEVIHIEPNFYKPRINLKELSEK